MKYLIKRNDFLRGAKRLDEKSEFLRDAKISGNELYQQLVKENSGWDSHGNTGSGSGPMANDIGWHDSLVGRFLNHLVRKAKVANNLRRIKPLITRLEGEFDRIAAEGFAYNMTDDEKKLYTKSILYSFFFALKEAVDNGDDIVEIINLTESAIKATEDIKDTDIDAATKTKLLQELNDFLEELKKIEAQTQSQSQSQTEEGSEEGEEGSEEGEEGSEEGEEGSEGSEEDEDKYSKLEASLPTMIKNLNALYYILKNYQSVNLLPFNKKEEEDAKKPIPYITQSGDTLTSIANNLEVNKNKLDWKVIKAKNEPELKKALDAAGKIAPEKVTLPKGLKLVLEKQGTSVDGNNVYKEEDHLTQAFGKLKQDITALVDTKDEKLPISAEFIRILLAKHKDSKNDRLIMALYDNINKYLVGNKKMTIQEKDPLYKESYEYLMPKNDKNPKGGKIEVVAEKIARFAKRALQFDGKNLYGGLGELADPLKKFVETLKVLIKNPIVNVKPKYVQQKDEVSKEVPLKQKDRETKYKKDELIKDIESATKKALELRKTDPEKAKKIQSQIDDKKAQLDKLDESVNESVYISKLMEIESGMRVIMLELNEALSKKHHSGDRRLLKFDSFMSYIKEADEPEETPAPEEENSTEAGDNRSGMTRSERIQDWFDSKCMTVKDYTMEKTEFEKVKANFEKLEKDKDGFVIDGYDPIIEILKLFNRAYKLYMSKFISKRSNGAGVSTAAEYTAFGDNGPYRNDKIFDVWESAVQDIMKQRKYEFIFDKKTNLRVGNEIRPGGGANLRKFMTDMLDGDSLYKSKGGFGDGGRGKQAELLDKYFGEPDAKLADAVDKVDESEEVKNNLNIAKDIEAAATKIKATKAENAVDVNGKAAKYAARNTFLILKIKNEKGEERQRALFIQNLDGSYVYMQYSKSFGTFKPYLDASILGHANNLISGDLPVSEASSDINYTKVKNLDFLNLLLTPGVIKVGMMSADGKATIKDEKITVIDAYWITKDQDGTNVVFDCIESGKEEGTDKKKTEKLIKQIEKATRSAAIVGLIQTKNEVIITKA